MIAGICVSTTRLSAIRKRSARSGALSSPSIGTSTTRPSGNRSLMNVRFTLALAVSLLSGGCAAMPPSAVKATVPPARPVAPAVVLGLAAGAISTGAGFMGAASSKISDETAVRETLTAHHGTCNPRWASFNTRVCADIEAMHDAGDAFHNVALGAFLGGGAAVVGTGLYLLWPSPQQTTPKPALARDLRLTPVLSPTGSELLISGSF